MVVIGWNSPLRVSIEPRHSGPPHQPHGRLCCGFWALFLRERRDEHESKQERGLRRGEKGVCVCHAHRKREMGERWGGRGFRAHRDSPINAWARCASARIWGKVASVGGFAKIVWSGLDWTMYVGPFPVKQNVGSGVTRAWAEG